MNATWDKIRNLFTRLARGPQSAPGTRGLKRAQSPAPQLDASELKTLGISWLIVGLGNPGPEYAATRHNVGYMAQDDVLARQGDLLEQVSGIPATACVLKLGNERALAVRSATFMNLSGTAIAPLAELLDIPAERIVVLHDELDLPPNKIRLKKGGNENGHNGLKSLSECLGTRDYLRVRIGIGRPPKGSSIPDYVLGPVAAGEGFDEAIATAAEAAELIVTEGLEIAQNRIHSRH